MLQMVNDNAPKVMLAATACKVVWRGAEVSLGGLVISVLATGPKVRGFKPGRGRWILRVIKFVARLPSEGT
jgi:hypothetical protein